MKTLELFIPIKDDTFRGIQSGNRAVIYEDEYFKPLFQYLTDHPNVGNFNEYKNVFELTFGLEIFTPSGDANPKLGSGNKVEDTFSVKMKVFMDESTTANTYVELIKNVLDIHPWEHPVIIINYENIQRYSHSLPLEFVSKLKKELIE